MCAGTAAQRVHHEEPFPLSWEVDMIQIHPTGRPGAGGEAGEVGVQLMSEEVGWARAKEVPTHSRPEDTDTACLGAWQLAALTAQIQNVPER